MVMAFAATSFAGTVCSTSAMTQEGSIIRLCINFLLNIVGRGTSMFLELFSILLEPSDFYRVRRLTRFLIFYKFFERSHYFRIKDFIGSV